MLHQLNMSADRDTPIWKLEAALVTPYNWVYPDDDDRRRGR
jgi:hypothetical protein